MNGIRTTARTFGRLDARAARPLKLMLRADLVFPYGATRCLLDYIYPTGACLLIEPTPKVSSTALLRFDIVSAFSQIAWVRDDQCGLLFDRALSPRVMEKLRWIATNREAYLAMQMREQSSSWL